MQIKKSFAWSYLTLSLFVIKQVHYIQRLIVHRINVVLSLRCLLMLSPLSGAKINAIVIPPLAQKWTTRWSSRGPCGLTYIKFYFYHLLQEAVFHLSSPIKFTKLFFYCVYWINLSWHSSVFQCKHDFCWVCQESWKKHSSATGGYFRCNRFEAMSKAEEKQDVLITEVIILF